MAAAQRQPPGGGGIPDGLILGLLGFLLGMTILVWTATGLAGLLAHGSRPSGTHFTRTPVAMRHLIGSPHDLPAAWPDTPPSELPGYGLFWGVFISQLMVLFVLTVFLIGVITRYRLVRAARRETEAAPPETAAVPEPRVARADLQPTDPPQATGAEAAPQPLPETVPGDLRVSSVLFAPSRSDKGKRVVQPAVLNAAGPVVVTTADPDTYHQTAGNRNKLGPVRLYDPSRLVDTPDRFRWAPHSGCEDPAKATTRARALLAPAHPHATADTAMYETATTLLRCWLHAAAVDGRPFRQVARWASGTGSGNGEAVRVLRTARGAAPGWSGEYESSLHAHPDRREAAQALVHRALESLNSIHIRDACTPGRTDPLDLESFLSERGTLYVVGVPIEDPRPHPGAMPLLTALVSSMVEHGRRMAAASPAGRLDPPMTLVLDDVAALAPIPELPGLLPNATPSADGLPTLAILRSREQARDRWPEVPWQYIESTDLT